MKYILTLTFIIISTALMSQKKDIDIKTEQKGDKIEVTAINNTEVRQEVILTIQAKNVSGYKKPITKLIGSGKTVKMIVLTRKKNKTPSLRFSLKYSPKPSKAETLARTKALKEKLYDKVGDLEKGIVVFSKDGCPRCHLTTSYFIDNDIEFTYINVTKDKEMNELMWTMLRDENIKTKNITMPVMMIDGEVKYNIPNLSSFVRTFKADQ